MLQIERVTLKVRPNIGPRGISVKLNKVSKNILHTLANVQWEKAI